VEHIDMVRQSHHEAHIMLDDEHDRSGRTSSRSFRLRRSVSAWLSRPRVVEHRDLRRRIVARAISSSFTTAGEIGSHGLGQRLEPKRATRRDRSTAPLTGAPPRQQHSAQVAEQFARGRPGCSTVMPSNSRMF
jgi:hypothetical protein